MKDQRTSLRLLDEDLGERLAIAVFWLTYLLAIGCFLITSMCGR
jgi:hypothetical protein